MLSKPNAGWITVAIGDFSGDANDMTDIAMDCLDTSIFALSTGSPVAFVFYGEKCDFVVRASKKCTYIVSDRDEATLYMPSVTYIELINEVVADIEMNIDAWSKWGNWMKNKKYSQERLLMLNEKLAEVKRLLGEDIIKK